MIAADSETDRPDDVADRLGAGVRAAFRDAARAGFRVSQEEVPTANGTLQISGDISETPEAVVFGYRAPYAPFVEFGTDPHYPPIEPLKQWAGIVLGDRSAAYAVQEKIGQEGTDPQPFVRPGRDAAFRHLRRQGLIDYVQSE